MIYLDKTTAVQVVVIPRNGGRLPYTKPDYIVDAPKDGKTYGRKDGSWAEVTGGGSVDAYTKEESDARFASKSGTYTKTEVDAQLAGKANSSDVYTKSEVYTQAEVRGELARKADDTEVVHKAGAETITGQKTFSAGIKAGTINIPTTNDGVTMAASEVDADNGKVTIVGDAGSFTFEVERDPLTDMEVATKGYVDGKLTELEGKVNGVAEWVDKTADALVGATSGKYIDCRTGNTITAAAFSMTDYIPVNEGGTIRISVVDAATSSQFVGFAWYDENKVAISPSSANRFINTDVQNRDRELIPPTGARYIRTSYRNDFATYGDFSCSMLMKGDGLADLIERHTEQIGVMSTEIESLENGVDSLEQKVLEKEVSVSVDEHTIEDKDSSNFYMWFVLPFDLSSDTLIAFGKALAYCNGIECYDKFGNYLTSVGYAASTPSFLARKTTHSIRLDLRKSNYSASSVIVLNYTSVNKAVFDEPLLISGARVDTTGKVVKHQNIYTMVYKCLVKPNTKYVMQTELYPNVVNTNLGIAYYSEDGTMLKQENAIIGTVDYSIGGFFNGYKFETPSKTAYVYLLVNNATRDNYDKPVYVLEYSCLNARTIAKEVTIWVLGDSISATGYNSEEKPWESKNNIGGWLGQFLVNTDVRVKSIYNYSIGGYTLSDVSDDGKSDNSYIKQLETAIADYNNGLIEKPDILMIIGCTNDVGQNRTITEAEIASSQYSSYEEYVERVFFTDNNDYYHKGLIPLANINNGKIIGAMRYIVERSGSVFENLKWFATTLPQSSRKDAVAEIACRRDMMYASARLGIPIADVWGEANMPMLWDYNSDWNGETANHRFLTDGIHTFYGGGSPAVTGYIRQGQFIARKFSEYFKYDMLELNGVNL